MKTVQSELSSSSSQPENDFFPLAPPVLPTEALTTLGEFAHFSMVALGLS